jgi:hypothetical protein
MRRVEAFLDRTVVACRAAVGWQRAVKGGTLPIGTDG